MRYLLYTILTTAIAGGAVMGIQQSPAPSEPPESKEAKEPSSQEQDSNTKGQQEEELESFTPSEKVPVDSAISFPVDI